MAHGCNGSENASDRSLWTGAAVTLSYRLGLNQYPASQNSLLLNISRALWKKLWWSCYILDRLVALDEGRDPYIKGSSWNVPMICLDDFDDSQSMCRQYIWPTQLLAKAFIEKARLCVPGGPPCGAESSSCKVAIMPDIQFDLESELIFYLYNWKKSSIEADLDSKVKFKHSSTMDEEAELIKYMTDRASEDLGWDSGWKI
jgi:hypothetical protein